MVHDGKLNSITIIRPKRLAELLAIGDATLWRWVNRGIWPEPIRIDGVTGWTLETIKYEIGRRKRGRKT